MKKDVDLKYAVVVSAKGYCSDTLKHFRCAVDRSNPNEMDLFVKACSAYDFTSNLDHLYAQSISSLSFLRDHLLTRDNFYHYELGQLIDELQILPLFEFELDLPF